MKNVCCSPGSSVHGILQARILEWVAIPFSGSSNWSRDQTWVSRITGRFFTIWAMREHPLWKSQVRDYLLQESPGPLVLQPGQWRMLSVLPVLPLVLYWQKRKRKVLVTQSCPMLCDPMDCGPPGSSVHGVLQGRILEWIAMPFSRESSQPRNQMWASHTAGRLFTVWATRVALKLWYCNYDILLNYMIWGAKLHSILITKVNPEIDENGKL